MTRSRIILYRWIALLILVAFWGGLAGWAARTIIAKNHTKENHIERTAHNH